MNFSSIEDVRNRIDQIDCDLVKLVAKRGECVKAASVFKTDSSAVRAPERVQQVIDKVRKQAADEDLSEDIIEKVYRAMIDAFIDYELEQYNQLQQEKS
ncbi:chorismate mutase [Klebsiella sp. BIGb0407]|uniref:chorismate mutase n=1 Tax=Klebsiella sp. BIGb0407 TaxID=2940603 RepID=UPI002169A313|nr:chorismate mutase [Klebsiella sp. BIGb0407]MCS3430185.1 isochorismate pyruvate lyase [Klebsiella sp. BIGb0407]